MVLHFLSFILSSVQQKLLYGSIVLLSTALAPLFPLHHFLSLRMYTYYMQAEDSFGFLHIKSSESIHFHIRFCLFLAINKHQHLPPVTTSSSSSSSWTDRKVGRHTDSGVDSRILGYIGLRLTCWPSKGSSHGTALLGSCPRPATI